MKLLILENNKGGVLETFVSANEYHYISHQYFPNYTAKCLGLYGVQLDLLDNEAVSILQAINHRIS